MKCIQILVIEAIIGLVLKVPRTVPLEYISQTEHHLQGIKLIIWQFVL